MTDPIDLAAIRSARRKPDRIVTSADLHPTDEPISAEALKRLILDGYPCDSEPKESA